jgi:UDP-2,3-diacylglucosamine hydrolase
MTNIFISDLHLEEERPDITELFFRFLRTEAIHAKALYILGDFFEMWIGDDNLSVFNQSVIKELYQTTRRGIPIYLQHGNRDFLLGKRFLRASGCTLLPDEAVITINDTPVLLMHGDTLCTADTAYLQFRKKSRIWLLQKLFLLKPLKKRLAIAKNMREKSKEHTSTVSDYIMDVTQAEVLRLMTKHQVQELIHGHTHRPGIHEFSLNGKAAKRIVLGPWHDQGSALICDDKGNKDLISF